MPLSVDDAEARIRLFERLILERGDPRGAYRAAIHTIRRLGFPRQSPG